MNYNAASALQPVTEHANDYTSWLLVVRGQYKNIHPCGGQAEKRRGDELGAEVVLACWQPGYRSLHNRWAATQGWHLNLYTARKRPGQADRLCSLG